MIYCFTTNANLGKYIKHPFSKLLITIVIILSIFITVPPTNASDLDDFEEAATADHSELSSKKKKVKEKKRKKARAEDDWSLFDLFIGILDFELGNKINDTLARVKEPTEITAKNLTFRQIGEPTLPFFQLEPKYLSVNSDICALDYELELGYGPYALRCRHTSFAEISPRDRMDLTQYLLFLRLSTASSLEYGFGMGSIYLQGNNDHSGFLMYFPVKFYPYESFGFQFKPTMSWINNNLIEDYDLALVFFKQYYSIKLGYRFLRVYAENLDGAYFGLAFHY